MMTMEACNSDDDNDDDCNDDDGDWNNDDGACSGDDDNDDESSDDDAFCGRTQDVGQTMASEDEEPGRGGCPV